MQYKHRNFESAVNQTNARDPYSRNKYQNWIEISMQYKLRNFEGVVNPTNAKCI